MPATGGVPPLLGAEEIRRGEGIELSSAPPEQRRAFEMGLFDNRIEWSTATVGGISATDAASSLSQSRVLVCVMTRGFWSGCYSNDCKK